MTAAHSSELATESVASVKFSFLTTDEVREHSFKKITEVQLFDNLDRPVPGGLYDPALGGINDRTLCKSCGQRPLQCPGHCGHIELVSPIYNPLLFSVLLNLLRRSCFCCHSFQDEREQIEKCVFQLRLIMKGDVIRAESVDIVSQSDLSDENDNFDAKLASGQNMTSLQYSRAMSLLDEFMKRKFKKCSRCGFKNPKLTHPTFGWLYMLASDETVKRNVIRGSKLDNTFNKEADEDEGQEKDSDADAHSSGDVCNGTPEAPSKSKKGRAGKLPSECFKQKKLFSGPLLPSEVKEHMKLLWENEVQLCSLICDIHREMSYHSAKKSYTMFFIEALLVPPIKFRPITMGGDSLTNHPQTILLSRVLQSNIDLGTAHKSDRSKVVIRWRDLQQSVNLLFGNKKSIGQNDNTGNGICQLLEKKEGIFRQKMMGKRVNYSCRSVISPDPYIAVNEIGIPPCFALKLTYPERVTPWNADKLRNAVINGPEVHPGATYYSTQSEHNKLPPARKTRISIARKLPSSRGIGTQLGRSVEHEHEGKVVYRHLQDGDVVLVNRQPTLHKPSIMAHIVRVLTGEKTLRMHYANCSTYNADFDGDEMNVHFPQDEISRAEAYQIVNANNQYIIPTSGDTKRGLIQDHIVSAVLLTKKDTFFSWDEYAHLLYSSGVSSTARVSVAGKSRRKVSSLVSEDEMELIVPAILKPKPLWTGKQVITSLLNHMTKSKGLPPFTFEAKCTLDNEFLTSQSRYDDSPPGGSEDPPFQIHENDFLNGVIDKAQFGKFGLIHTVQELYGPNTAGTLLSGLSRLFTVFLQLHGFTCGVDDLLLKENIAVERRKTLKEADKIDRGVYLKFAKNLEEEEDAVPNSEEAAAQSLSVSEDLERRVELQEAIELKIRDHGENAVRVLDTMMSNAATNLGDKINAVIFPTKAIGQSADKSKQEPKQLGLSKSFPNNCFFLMTKSGAKGTQANFSQVSSLLGQQSLEGKRVPLMISGKTLPCFSPWDPALRAGGFITDCFLTGLRPQEYYFHCMAGREGLVDTAVKTSRSGYLQRCLVKNLECLKVCYDGTVRDADGSIVQFCYGEDGLDVHKTSFISKFDTLTCNQKVVKERLGNLQSEDAQITLRRSDNHDLHKKLKKNVGQVISSRAEKHHASNEIIREKNKKALDMIERRKVTDLMMLKYLSSLAQPGEPVGVIAAQSVGEPSTQMTLNTFHHAGQKASNVTLGIPRLQEILMRASDKIQTPIMSCPLIQGKTKDDADKLAGALQNISVSDIVESMKVSVLPYVVENKQVSTVYKLKVKFYKQKKFPEKCGIVLEEFRESVKYRYLIELEKAIESHVKMLEKISGIKNIIMQDTSDHSEETTETEPSDHPSHRSKQKVDESDDDDDAEDMDTDALKRKRQNNDEMEYEETTGTQNDEGEGSDVDQVELDGEINADADEPQTVDAKTDGESKSKSKSKKKSRDEKKEKREKKVNSEIGNLEEILAEMEKTRHIFVSFEGTRFEAHFKLTGEPHILLSQIAQKAAKNVYVKKLAKVSDCSVDYDSRKGESPKLQISGVDFHSLWSLQSDLDINKIESNDIYAILKTYGIEAARATIVREIQNVFGTYGISTDFRHLSLIADFMTHSGKYRSMSRHGMADCVSPFSKMSFETASNFIVSAAYHGEVDNLESPSARICLGMPVKMGTGCFDLMQKVEL
ncbi:DNA-directed RNA polymerase [Ranunculus cassubicifolius]